MTDNQENISVDSMFKRYRPQRWEDFIGQDKTVESLRKSIITNNISSGYGFIGPVGCGKTSAAYVFAKALNCENQPSDGNPCNECPTCLAIDKNIEPDVRAMSMADDGGVDKVRSIVKKSWVSSSCRVRVWILDEAHNMSKAAFEALLDTLGERRMNAVFILCSTNPEKFPESIQSRIQKRKFRLVDSETMVSHLEHIVENEDLDIDESAISEAVRRGRGSVRDSINSLEEILQLGESSETDGKIGRSLLIAIGTCRVNKAIGTIAIAEQRGIDSKELMEQTIEDIRNAMLTYSGVDEELVAPFPLEKVDLYMERIGGLRGATEVIMILGEHLNRTIMGENSRLQLELGVLNAIERVRESQLEQEEESKPW